MRRALFLIAFSLAGCGGMPRPDPVIKPPQIITVDKVVTTQCLTPADIRPRPAPVKGSLTGDAVHDVDILAARVIDDDAWADVAAALLTKCAQPVPVK